MLMYKRFFIIYSMYRYSLLRIKLAITGRHSSPQLSTDIHDPLSSTDCL